MKKQTTNEKIIYPVFPAEDQRPQQETGVSTPRQHLSRWSSSPASGGSGHTPLRANLSLKFIEDSGAVRLVERDHYGPLIVQKPFYPEGYEVCHVVIVHPPGGVVGGDELKITATVGPSASAQITTPGAAKWYKANGHVSRQQVKLSVGQGATLEWVPQETIFFDNARVAVDHEVRLEKEARYIGCEILCFGRTASGECFNGGEIRQQVTIRREEKLVWFEQVRLGGGSAAMKNPLVLAGKTVCATLIAVGENLPGSQIASMREEAGTLADGGIVGISQFKSVVVARYLGDSSETARNMMLHLWGALRPVMLGRSAIVPRMWKT